MLQLRLSDRRSSLQEPSSDHVEYALVNASLLSSLVSHNSITAAQPVITTSPTGHQVITTSALRWRDFTSDLALGRTQAHRRSLVDCVSYTNCNTQSQSSCLETADVDTLIVIKRHTGTELGTDPRRYHSEVS